jgi:hypothetical protein
MAVATKKRKKRRERKGKKKKSVLSRKEKKEMRKLVRYLEHTIDDLIRDARKPEEKKLFKGLKNSIQTTGVYFYNRPALAAHGLSILFGMHKTNYAFQVVTDKMGHKVGVADVRAKNVIYMPAKHLFKNGQLTLAGVSTLVHEWSHYPKNVRPVAEQFKVSREAAEEFVADIMAARVLKKMGRFSNAQILNTFRGRVSLFKDYNRKLGEEYMWRVARAITPKGQKVEIPWERPLRKEPLYRRAKSDKRRRPRGR